MLEEPSPTKARLEAGELAEASRSVSRSASACSGWCRSESALTTGTPAARPALDRVVPVDAGHDRRAVAGEHARGVLERLAAAELQLVGAEHDRQHAEPVDRGLQRDARARGRLLEEAGDAAPGRAAGVQVGRLVERLATARPAPSAARPSSPPSDRQPGRRGVHGGPPGETSDRGGAHAGRPFGRRRARRRSPRRPGRPRGARDTAAGTRRSAVGVTGRRSTPAPQQAPGRLGGREHRSSSTASSRPMPRTEATPGISARLSREQRADLAGVLDQALALDRVEHGQRRGGDRRAAAEGGGVVAALEAVADLVGHQRADRQAAARPLASADGVGLDAVPWKANQAPQRPMPVCTSSNSSSASWRSHSARAACRNSSRAATRRPRPAPARPARRPCAGRRRRQRLDVVARHVRGSRRPPARRARAWPRTSRRPGWPGCGRGSAPSTAHDLVLLGAAAGACAPARELDARPRRPRRRSCRRRPGRSRPAGAAARRAPPGARCSRGSRRAPG